MSTITRSGVDQVLERAVAEGAVPQVIAMAADRDGVIYEGAVGPRVVGEQDTVTADTHLRLMSMTKMVATTVALQLVEQGKLDLDAPVERYCPEFAEVQVLDGFDGDVPRTRPPASKATVRQLVTHTTGLGYWFFSPELVKWEAATGIPNVLSGLNAIFKAPMLADPGTRFEYGINIDWLGQVIHGASGMKLDEAVARVVTEPLGMNETAFVMSDAQRANSIPVHMKSEDGAWAATEVDLVRQPEYWAGGHGLYSTPRDYMKFQRMLLGNGTSPDGVKILEAATVKAAFTNQIGELDFPAEIKTADPVSTCDFIAGPGFKFGYGLLLSTEDIPGARRAGSGSWAGLLNTHFWIDRTTGITAAIYSQTLPFVDPPALQLYQEFEGALYASL